MSAMAFTAVLKIFVILVTISTARTATAQTFPPPSSPPVRIPDTITYTYPPSIFVRLLSTLGFQDLAVAVAKDKLSLVVPTTIFAPTDSSLLTCPNCSLPLLIQEHSILGLYNLHFLRNLAFGTKIETLALDRCLTVTAFPSKPYDPVSTRKVFVNGVEITKPDLFNNGLVIIHGVHGFVSHLSPTSCAVEKMTTLAFPNTPPHTPEFLITRLMLKEAMMRLRVNGFSLLALAMRVKYPELSELKSMTIFALDDESIFAGGGGHAYVTDLMLHIVPNMLLKRPDLLSMPRDTVIPTMERHQKLVVTTAGGEGFLAPMRINYVKISSFDIVSNTRVVVHTVSTQFPHLHPPPAAKNQTCEQNQTGLCDQDSSSDYSSAQVAGYQNAY